jgi:hypothetical protein
MARPDDDASFHPRPLAPPPQGEGTDQPLAPLNTILPELPLPAATSAPAPDPGPAISYAADLRQVAPFPTIDPSQEREAYVHYEHLAASETPADTVYAAAPTQHLPAPDHYTPAVETTQAHPEAAYPHHGYAPVPEQHAAATYAEPPASGATAEWLGAVYGCGLPNVVAAAMASPEAWYDPAQALPQDLSMHAAAPLAVTPELVPAAIVGPDPAVTFEPLPAPAAALEQAPAEPAYGYFAPEPQLAPMFAEHAPVYLEPARYGMYDPTVAPMPAGELPHLVPTLPAGAQPAQLPASTWEPAPLPADIGIGADPAAAAAATPWLEMASALPPGTDPALEFYSGEPETVPLHEGYLGYAAHAPAPAPEQMAVEYYVPQGQVVIEPSLLEAPAPKPPTPVDTIRASEPATTAVPLARPSRLKRFMWLFVIPAAAGVAIAFVLSWYMHRR